MHIVIKVGEVTLEVRDNLNLHEDSMPSVDKLTSNFETLLSKAEKLLDKCVVINNQLAK